MGRGEGVGWGWGGSEGEGGGGSDAAGVTGVFVDGGVMGRRAVKSQLNSWSEVV